MKYSLVKMGTIIDSKADIKNALTDVKSIVYFAFEVVANVNVILQRCANMCVVLMFMIQDKSG